MAGTLDLGGQTQTGTETRKHPDYTGKVRLITVETGEAD